MSFLTDKNIRLLREKMTTESFIQNNFLISEEAYFGKDNDFVTDLIAAIDDFKMGYDKTFDIKKHNAKLDMMLPLVQRIERVIASNVNVGRVSITLIAKEVNAFCLPMCWDTALISRANKAVELDDIVETSKGYRFKTPNGKIMIFGLGLGLFDKDFTSEEIAAILLHEVGHGMQHMLHGVNNNLQYHTVKWLSKALSDILRVLFSAVDPQFFYNIIDHLIIDEDKRSNKVGFLEKFMIYLGTYGSERREIADDLESQREKSIKKIKEDNIFMKFFKELFKGIGWVVTAVFSILIYPFALVFATIKSIMVANHGIDEHVSDGFLVRNKKWEQFADHFATVYGLGPQLATALKKLNNAFYRMSNEIGVGTLQSMLLATPIARLGAAASAYQSNTYLVFQHGYDNTKGRITNLYKTLKYELENNKDLTPKEKKEIGEQIQDLQSSYESLFDKDNVDPTYAIIKDYINTNMDTTRTAIEENVLEVLSRNKENFKEIVKSNGNIDAAPKRSVSENLQGIMKVAKETSKNKQIAAIQPKLAAKANVFYGATN